MGVKTGFGELICRVWANQAGKKRSKTFENVRKYSKIFENIQILSRNVQKYSKIFDYFVTRRSYPKVKTPDARLKTQDQRHEFVLPQRTQRAQRIQ